MNNQAAWIIDQLVAQGVTSFCIAPGSRSAPLALAAASHPNANISVHYDERGLGFYALGYGKGSKFPAAVITTSGTAVANLLPSVMEASQSSTPLILLTADRPHELRACGANQTTDQVKLFSNVVRFQTDLSPHLSEQATRSIIAQGFSCCFQNIPGPVHFNCPFQEPLFHPNSSSSRGNPIPLILPTLSASPMQIQARRGVILLGETSSDPSPILQLAQRLGWPVFADLLSNSRSIQSDSQIRHFDYLIRSQNGLTPDFILHFGGSFISKHILEWQKEIPRAHISPFPSLQDPARRLTLRIQSDIKPFCDTFQAETDPSWLPKWQQLDSQAKILIEEHFQSSVGTESHAIRSLPKDRPMFFANSMPIRDADHFFFPEPCPRIFANRGVSGIDGNIATAAGIAESLDSSLLVFIGDQTALHDLNSLPLIKKHRLLLVISNNFGGGIFDYLPVSKSPYLDTVFTASHCWNFKHAAAMFDIPYVCKERHLENLPPFGIVELITDRKENHRFQSELIQKISQAQMFGCETGVYSGSS